ncbi:MAG: hypothetical protein ABSA17_00970 [Rhabdochlamydiaceae bacterium]|jgi:hypothetical protein
MSFTNLICSAGRGVYHNGPKAVVTAASSAVISYVASSIAGRYIAVPAPIDAAKIGAASAAVKGLYEAIIPTLLENEKYEFKRGSIINTVKFSSNFAVNWVFNPYQTIQSQGIFVLITQGAMQLSNWIMNMKQVDDSTVQVDYRINDISLDRESYYAFKGALENGLKTIASGFVASLIGSRLGFDTRAFTIFTVAGSVLFNMTRPIFKKFEQGDNSWMMYAKRAVALTTLSKVTSDCLDLGFPLYMPFIKAAAVASVIIGGLEYLDTQLTPYLEKQEDQKRSKASKKK